MFKCAEINSGLKKTIKGIFRYFRFCNFYSQQELEPFPVLRLPFLADQKQHAAPSLQYSGVLGFFHLQSVISLSSAIFFHTAQKFFEVVCMITLRFCIVKVKPSKLPRKKLSAFFNFIVRGTSNHSVIKSSEYIVALKHFFLNLFCSFESPF